MIEVGDIVEVLDDTLVGEVKAIRGNQATIETDDGFEMVFPLHELVKQKNLTINVLELKKAIQDEKKHSKPKTRRPLNKTKKQPPMEVDLHIAELVTSSQKMTDFEMLNLQLRTAQNRLEFAIQNHIPRIVFIHGIGKGVLRAELESLLRRYEEVEFYDADYQKYGRGATEVYIYQNI